MNRQVLFDFQNILALESPSSERIHFSVITAYLICRTWNMFVKHLPKISDSKNSTPSEIWTQSQCKCGVAVSRSFFTFRCRDKTDTQNVQLLHVAYIVVLKFASKADTKASFLYGQGYKNHRMGRFLSAAIGQRPRNYLSSCPCSCSPFGSFPL